VALGEQFTLSFTLENAGMGGGKNLQLPALEKFHIMAGPNQSTSMQFINGAMSSSVTYTYVLQPKEVGKFTIAAARIDVGGTTLQSQPLTVEIVKASARAQQPAAGGTQEDLSRQIGDNLFLRAAVDRTRLLQGEQITVTFRLYTRVSVSSYGIAKNPTLTGFWGEEIENPKTPQLTTETINGKQYRVGVIRKMALFPTQSGGLEISPMEVQTVVQVQARRSADPFDAFFRDPFGQNVNYTVKSEPIRITVDPLPPDAPAGFAGAVGKFTMTVAVDRTTTKANEPVTITMKIAGTGNIKLLESPALELPPDFEQYAPKVSETINRGSATITGTKTFEMLVVPRYPGTKVIKPVTFVSFDPGKGRYVTTTAPAIELQVEQGAASAAPALTGGDRADVEVISQDIRFIKIGESDVRRKGGVLPGAPWVVVLLLLPAAACAGSFVYARRRSVLMSDAAAFRNRRALKVARTGLHQAEQLLRQGPSAGGAFHAEVARALWKYLGDKLDVPPAEISLERVAAELGKRSVDGKLVAEVAALLERCEMTRFAPVTADAGGLKNTYDEASRLIVALERHLK
jgi:HEPN domain-containing protein